MSMQMNSRWMVVLSALGLFVTVCYAAPEGWEIQQISSGEGMISQWELASDGDQIAYIDGIQIMLWTVGQQVRQISNSQNVCTNIRLSSGKAAWFEVAVNKSQVMFWDGQITRQISSGDNDCQSVVLSGDKVAWMERIVNKTQVMFWDGQQTRQLSSGQNTCEYIQLSEGKIAWVEYIQNIPQVMLWDGIIVSQLSGGQNACGDLQLSKGKVAWSENLGSNKYLVVLWDGQANRQLTNGQTEIRDVRLSDGKVAWIESNNYIMFWDGLTTRQLNTGQHYCSQLQLSGGKVLWFANIGTEQVMYWDGQESIQISQNLKGKSPIKYLEGMIVWFETGRFMIPRVYLYFWEEGHKTLLATLDSANQTAYFLSPSFIAWIGPDAMDDAQVYIAMKGGTPAVVKGPEGDVNRDLKVDIADLAIVSANWMGKAKERIAGETLERNPEWAAQGSWEFGRPTGMGGTEKGFADPQAGATGRNVYGVNLYGDYSTKVGGPYCLTAGPFDCSGYEGVELAFARWLNTDSAEYVRCEVEVSNDGSQWQMVWANPAGAGVFDSEWQAVSYDIGAVADGQATVWVRWTHGILSDRAFACSGWNIDDVEIWGERK